jgi:hypothetical protein
MEEIVALFSVFILTGVGWVAAKICFAKIIGDENCAYFAPALGAGICGVVAYVAIHIYQPWLIGVFCLAVVGSAIVFRKRLQSPALAEDKPWRLFRFTALALVALYGMQIALYGLFSRVHPGIHEVWSLFNLTGAPPPDQMFAWHQAMFADQHRHYPTDPFLGEMDLYDRPQLGGYITLFFFKLLGLPLTEENFVYPPDPLRFYHCLWWLLNNLYLLGVAPLFRRLFGYRGAIIAVAATALGSFFFICNAGSWMKFAAGYPFLLALLLFLENRGPWLQAALCAISYYIHGSVLPFLAGFGALQLLAIRYPVMGRPVALSAVARFATLGLVLVGAWFVVVRWVGSRQPLLYHYLYDAGLTDAQTTPVAELAKAFYSKHTWSNLSLFPLRSLMASWLPVTVWPALKTWMLEASKVSDLANILFSAQRFCLYCALGLTAGPLVIAGGFKTLALKHAGKMALCLYLIPTLLVALVYRIDWAFSLHVLVLYHSLCLFFFVAILRTAPLRYVLIMLAVVALEGTTCLLFADVRLLPARALVFAQLTPAHMPWLAGYFALLLLIMGGAWQQLRHFPAGEGDVLLPQGEGTIGSGILAATWKILIGLVIVAVVIAIYSLYCLRFYPGS